MNIDMEKVDEIIQGYQEEEAPFVPLLQDLNQKFRYLPREVLVRVSQKMGIPLSRLFNLATFYKSFSLVPRGKHEIQVCMGTACHVRGAPQILEGISRELQIQPGQTRDDGKFTLETVNCVGACALGPLVVADGQYRGHLTLKKTARLLEGFHD